MKSSWMMMVNKTKIYADTLNKVEGREKEYKIGK